MHIHRRQFVIGPKPIDSVPSWVTTDIPNVGYLCHCPELRVTLARDADGNSCYLIGLAVQTDANKLDPVDEIAIATQDTIHNVYSSWAGRWVLIVDGKLYMDSGGLLGCFYSLRENPHGAKELWVSSSAALLADLLAADTKPIRSIYHAVGIDWYPPPQSRFRSIRRLLPSQGLMLGNGALLSLGFIPPTHNFISLMCFRSQKIDDPFLGTMLI